LRNLLSYCTVCDDKDLILVVSDGIHDNLDPQYFGKLPSDFNIESKNNSWNTVEDIMAGIPLEYISFIFRGKGQVNILFEVTEGDDRRGSV
jgi:hypothetical protein